jgi:hypothetical protein
VSTSRGCGRLIEDSPYAAAGGGTKVKALPDAVRAFEKERHVRTLVTIGVCGAILGAASACTTCWTPPVNASIRAGSNTVGFGNRAGAPNYYCQPGVCQTTGRDDPDYRVCLGGFGYKNAAGAKPNKKAGGLPRPDCYPSAFRRKPPSDKSGEGKSFGLSQSSQGLNM